MSLSWNMNTSHQCCRLLVTRMIVLLQHEKDKNENNKIPNAGVILFYFFNFTCFRVMIWSHCMVKMWNFISTKWIKHAILSHIYSSMSRSLHLEKTKSIAMLELNKFAETKRAVKSVVKAIRWENLGTQITRTRHTVQSKSI